MLWVGEYAAMRVPKCYYLIPFLFLLTGPAKVRSDTPRIIGTVKADTVQTLFGWRICPLKDQNGDGHADFAIWDYRNAIHVYHGGTTLSENSVLRIDSVLMPGAIGDANDDGALDIACLGRTPSHWKHHLYLCGVSIDSIRDASFGIDSILPGVTSAICKDLDGNGINELVSNSQSPRGGIQVFEITFPSDSLPAAIFLPHQPKGIWRAFGEQIVAGDFNGDDTADFAANLRYNQLGPELPEVLLYWGGVDFDSIPDLRISRPGPFQLCYDRFGIVMAGIGDANGDGYDDIIVSHGEGACDTVAFVYFGGPQIDTLPDLILPDHTVLATGFGDINDDGYDDFATSYFLQSSSFSYVNIYYGGPDVDSIIDKQIWVWEMPGYNINFGMGIAGLGDVDGDGVDDYAISSVDDFGYGQVYVMAGEKVVTDVEDDLTNRLPVTAVLHSSYPNPFNSSTIISFDLPRRANVTLSIVNILGQEVARLVDQEMSAGSYSVEWDGRDASSEPVASGVYLYRLETEDGVLSRKMLLLR